MADDSKGPAPVEINGKTYQPLADGKYDAIVMGTGLKECIVSGLLSVKGLKVLHIDRNDYYGGESASLNLTNLYRRFVKSDEDPPKEYYDALGADRDYNVDLIPKFIMAAGKLVKILIHTGVTRYLGFKSIDGSYVFKDSGGVHKVPANEVEALKTGLVGFFQKRKLRNFLQYLSKYDEEDPKTWDGMDLRRVPMSQVYAKFGLDENSQDFVGHAMALQTDESYLSKPAIDAVNAIKLYAMSLERYGQSPYIYPEYGLGGLPEGFSRLSAIHGGVYMLRTDVSEVALNEKGEAIGIISGTGNSAMAATAPYVVGDPSYFPESKVRRTGRVVRSICILDAPVKDMGGAASGQIILPQKQCGRRNDIYVSVVSAPHGVAPRGKYIAIVSTTVENEDDPRRDVVPGLRLLGSIKQRFDSVSETFEPVSDGRDDKCYISKSYDASSHFESTTNDVLDLYERILGEKFDLNISSEIPPE